MLTTILKRPYFITRYQELPLREEREAFLKHIRDQGTSHAALRSICSTSWINCNSSACAVSRSMRSKRQQNAGTRSSVPIRERGLTKDRPATSPTWRRSGCETLYLSSAGWWREALYASRHASLLLQALWQQDVTLDHFRRCNGLPGRAVHRPGGRSTGCCGSSSNTGVGAASCRASRCRWLHQSTPLRSFLISTRGRN